MFIIYFSCDATGISTLWLVITVPNCQQKIADKRTKEKKRPTAEYLLLLNRMDNTPQAFDAQECNS